MNHPSLRDVVAVLAALLLGGAALVLADRLGAAYRAEYGHLFEEAPRDAR